MREITDAVVLMAGTGSRLRASGEMLPKPLVPIFGRPLISYIIDGLLNAGVRNLHAVVGSNADLLVAALRPLIPSEMRLNPIPNPDWQKQNGLSVLCAAGIAKAPFFLTMGDHLFDPSLLAQVAEQAEPGELNLAVDRKIDAIFDLDDAMKVQTTGDRVSAIGKTLATYDAIDTGVFLCPNDLFDYLRRARRRWRLQPGRRRAADGGGGEGACDRYRPGLVAGCRYLRDAEARGGRAGEQTQTGRTVGALVATGRSWARQLSSWLEERAQPRVHVSLQDLWV